MLRVLDIVKAMIGEYSVAASVGELPSEKDMSGCVYTIEQMSTLTGKERRETLEACGVTAIQMPFFLRALQRLCCTHSCAVVESKAYSLHPIRSAAAWTVSNATESVFGRSKVATSSALLAAPVESPQVSTPSAPLPRKTVGAVGLRNQGSTCYLNSLIQSLYRITEFRTAIYSIPAEEDEGSPKTIPLALQRLFYNLETSFETVETTELTTSFGWSARDSFVQHDAHELTRKLLDNLEEKLKKCGQRNVILDMFCGAIENYTYIEDADYHAVHPEPFYDLTLVIKNCGNIYESLNNLVAPDILDGKNKYCLERDGEKKYHRAERGVRISKLPPVLLLHLSRIDYDPVKGDMCKVLTRWDYYEVIDMGLYCPKKQSEGGDGSDMKYQLHGVLVHSGKDAGFGHYYCYISGSDGWVKYNDEIVEKAAKSDVFGANFGGTTVNYWGNEVNLTTEAYMLVYVKRDMFSTICRDFSLADIPDWLRQMMEKDKAEQQRLKLEQAEDHLYIKAHVITIPDVEAAPELLASPYCRSSPKVTVRALKTEKLTSIQEQIEESTGIPVDDQQFWIHDFRETAFRFQKNVDVNVSMADTCLKTDYRTHRESVLFVFSKQAALENPKYVEADNNMLLTHHKLYLPRERRLHYLGPILIGSSIATHIGNFEKKVRQLSGKLLEEKTPLEVMAENCDGTIVMGGPIAASGDIFIWQEKLSEEDREMIDYPTVADYRHFLRHKATVHVHLNQSPNFPFQFDEVFADDMTYSQVQRIIAKHSNAQADHIRLAQLNPDTKCPYFAKPKQKDNLLLKDLLRPHHGGNYILTDTLFYEVCPFTVAEIESSNLLNFEYFNEELKPVSGHVLLFPQPGRFTIGEMLEKCRKELQPPVDGPLRLLDTWRGKLYNIYQKPDGTIKDAFEERAEYRLEKVPSPVPNVPLDSQSLIHVHHVARTSSQPTFHGDPFSIYVQNDELIDEVMKRVGKKLNLSDQAMVDWKTCVGANKSIYDLDSDVPVVEQLSKLRSQKAADETDPSYFLALDHAVIAANRRFVRKEERGLKISN